MESFVRCPYRADTKSYTLYIACGTCVKFDSFQFIMEAHNAWRALTSSFKLQASKRVKVPAETIITLRAIPD